MVTAKLVTTVKLEVNIRQYWNNITSFSNILVNIMLMTVLV